MATGAAAGSRGVPAVALKAATAASVATPTARMSQLPMIFAANQGQADPQVAFTASGPGYRAFLTRQGMVLALASRPANPVAHRGSRGRPAAVTVSTMSVRFAGASPLAVLAGAERLPGTANYLIGSDPSRWHRDLPTYAQVTQPGIYPGIDLQYLGGKGQLEYVFTAAPGANLDSVRARIDGAAPIVLEPGGDISVPLATGSLKIARPHLYQAIGGSQVDVPSAFFLTGPNEVGIRVGSHDLTRPLTIDPTILYSTYLGGTGQDNGFGIAVDAAGDAFVTGNSLSTDFPVIGGVQTSSSGNYDAFIAKLTPGGTALTYSTYIGGSGLDDGNGIAIDASGDAYVVGDTSSTDFPTGSPIQATNHGGSDAFVVKLNPSGSSLLSSTYLGGSGDDAGYGIAVDSTGSAHVTGTTFSADFPTAAPYQATFGGIQNAFVARLNSAGTALMYSTYLGGAGHDDGFGIATDAAAATYLTGDTTSTNFPQAVALQATNHGGYDAFIAKLTPAGGALVYSTYLGGALDDFGLGVAADGAGNAYVAGSTGSVDFPTASALQAASGGGGMDGFLARLNPTGSALAYSTYLGGSGIDDANAIAIDGSGDAFVTGDTQSANFPTANPFQGSLAGITNAFVSELNLAGSALVYSSYLGGTDNDFGRGIAVGSTGDAYLVGDTSSTNLPTVSPLQPSNAGTVDAFVARIGVSNSAIYTAASTQQYTLAGSDGSTWTTMDAVNLGRNVTPTVNSTAIIGANADLFTNSPGYNQDLGIFVSDNGAPATLLAWKESGGFAGTYSPNAAFVQSVYPMVATHTYTFTMRWKTNKPEAGGVLIYAGAGAGAPYSPTRLTADVMPAGANPSTAVSTQQYTLSGSDGSTWATVDAANLVISVTRNQNSTATLGANVDLFTNTAGYNQDVGIFVSDNGGADTLVAWKESGGFAGTYSPNAAFVQGVYPIVASHTYNFKLKWKTNKPEPGGVIVYAAAGGGAPYSPTRLTADVVAAGANPYSVMSTQQYTLSGNDGATWTPIDASNLVTAVTSPVNSTAILGANVDLFTNSGGYNQDIGIFVSDNGGADVLVAWKESGGFAGIYSPNAAFVQSVYPVLTAHTYTFKLKWKTNNPEPGGVIVYAAAGAGAPFSPTRLTAQIY